MRRLAPRDDVRVIADGPTEAAALAGLARRRPVIYNAHNLESAYRHELQASGGLGSPRKLRRFERGVLARAAEAWMVSEADAAAARELCPSVRVRLVPNVVDVSAIRPVVPDGSAQRALFVGNFSYEPNRNGLRFLLDEVMPRVWAQLPDARLRLVGAGLEEPPSDDPRVEPLGFVEELADAYAGVSAAVVPLLQGGGTPLKFVEALAYGLPIVATPRAAAGLAVRDGEHCLLADGGRSLCGRARARAARRCARPWRTRPSARRRALLDRGAHIARGAELTVSSVSRSPSASGTCGAQPSSSARARGVEAAAQRPRPRARAHAPARSARRPPARGTRSRGAAPTSRRRCRR